ncbi:MAG: hypothetical protein ACI8QU_000004 [Devosia litorisediminis]
MRESARGVKRPQRSQPDFAHSVTAPARYSLPEGIVGLKGPVDKPAPGTLPLRGDLAHVALADRYLAAHYVIPHVRTIGSAPATLKLTMRDDADDGATLAAGEEIELLDCAGDWAWIACGPEGPSGYVRLGMLAPGQ